MAHTSLFTALWRAFYAQALYLEVYQEWQRRIFALLALLCVLTSLTTIIKPIGAISDFRATTHKIISQLPTIRFNNAGLMSINKDSPLLIKSSGNGTLLLVFDMKATPTTLAHYQPLLFSFGRIGFYTYRDTSNTPSTPSHTFKAYKDYLHFLANRQLTAKQMINALSYFMLTMHAVFYGIAAITSFFLKIFIGLFMAFVTMGIAFAYRLPLLFNQAFRLSILAFIPPSLLEFIYNALSLPENPTVKLGLTALSFIYVVFIVRSLKSHLNQQDRKSDE